MSFDGVNDYEYMKMLKDKLALGELATTPSSCLDCLATDLSWEMYYIMKEKEED